MRAWAWAGQYLITMVLALLLGFILGSLPLFREAGIGTAWLTAAHMIQFLGYAGALVLLWLLGHAARTRIPRKERISGSHANSPNPGHPDRHHHRAPGPLAAARTISRGDRQECVQLALRGWEHRGGSMVGSGGVQCLGHADRGASLATALVAFSGL